MREPLVVDRLEGVFTAEPHGVPLLLAVGAGIVGERVLLAGRHGLTDSQI